MGSIRNLSVKERGFVDAYMGGCRGNATAAAVLAGFAKKSAHVTGSRLLRKAKVAAAIAERVERAARSTIADRVERDEILTNFARDPKVHEKERRQAIIELNRCDGRHSSTVNVNARLTIEDLAAETRRLADERRAKKPKAKK